MPEQPSRPQQETRVVQASPASRDDRALPGFEHRYATVDGVRLHYVTGGNPEGEMLVLFAGFPESWCAWRKIMPRLGERYRLMAPDLPGQGDSDRPIAGYDTQALATAAHGLLEQLGIDHYHLAGHDVGAWVAYLYAHLFAGEVKRLVLLDAGIPGVTLPDAVPLAPDKAWRTWHFAFHTIPDLPEALLTGREREYLDWFVRRKAADPQAFSDDDVGEYLRVFTKAGGLRAGLAYYRAAGVSAAQAVVFLHPTTPPLTKVLAGIPGPIEDYPAETTRSALGLVVAGHLTRYRKTKVILSHGGGFLPYAATRFAELKHSLAPERSVDSLIADMKSFYFDTALTAPSGLPSLLAFAARGHVLFGTDYPYASEAVSKTFTRNLDEYRSFEEGELDEINRGAAPLLPRLERLNPAWTQKATAAEGR